MIAGLNKIDAALFWAAIILALSYLFLPFSEGSFAIISQKASACILLALFAYRSIENARVKKLLTLALLCSALGDIFLAIRTADYFTHGLGAFLVAHLIYISIFAKAYTPANQSQIKMVASALIVIFAGLMMYLLWPELGALKAPVFLYIAVISLMAITALFSSYPILLVSFGAISFLASDATIAINKFLYAFTESGPIIWITYILAQALLTLAIIKGERIKNAGI